MSYRRAWTLIEAMNAGFGQPPVEAQAAGMAGGGATLSAFGAEVAAQYRTIERAAAEAAGPILARFAPDAGKDGREPDPRPG